MKITNMRSPEDINRVVVTGVDGSGKSTAAHAAARLMSEAYPDNDIRVADSTGLYHYGAGEIVAERFKNLDRLEPGPDSSRLASVLKMGAFTAIRQFMEHAHAHAKDSFTIGVRDPFRVDLAVYLPVFMGEDRVPGVDQRLKLLNRTTIAAHPNLVAFLDVDAAAAQANTATRENVVVHETHEKIALAAREFPTVLESYQRLYGVPNVSIQALTPHSADQLAESFEPFIKPKS